MNITTAPRKINIDELGTRWTWIAHDSVDGVAVASSKGDAAQSGTMLDRLIAGSLTRGRICEDDIITIHKDGEVFETFRLGDRL